MKDVSFLCRLEVDVGLHSPLETTVLDSSSPLDGIPLPYLLHAVVELTSSSLSSHHQHYCGDLGIVVEINEQSLQVSVEVQSDSTRINIINSRMLKLSPPIPGNMVRVIRGDSAGTTGSITSQHDNSQVLVQTDDNCPSILFLLTDLVRLDSSSRQVNLSTASPSNISGTEDSIVFSQTNEYSPSFSTEWRVNSSMPSSPMDSLVSNNFNPSPSSSLVGNVTSPGNPCSSLVGNVTSPGNPWSVSSSSDYAYCLSSDSSASSNCSTAAVTNSIQQHQPTMVQSMPTPSNGLTGSNNYTRQENYQNALPNYSSLPNNQFEHHLPIKQQQSPSYAYPLGDSAHHKPTSPPSNLYPVVTGDTVYLPESNTEMDSQIATNGFPCGQSNNFGSVTYPTLPPSYASVTSPCNVQYGRPWSNVAMVNCNQQSQYTPVLLSNGYTFYGYQQVQPQQYQSAGVTNCMTHPQLYNDHLRSCGGNLYPQLRPTPQMTTPTNQQSFYRQPYSTSCQVPSPCKTGLVNRFKNLQAGSRKKPSLYPQLPLNGKPMESKETPWDEFKSLINSIQCRQSCRPLSLESVIDTAIEGLSTKNPPQQWYNPLAEMGMTITL